MKSIFEDQRNWVIDRVEQDYAEVMANKAGLRRAAIREIPFPARRFAELRLLNSIESDRTKFGQWLGVELPPDYHFRGSTGHSTIIQHDRFGLMTRVHRGSQRMTERERLGLRDEFEAKHHILREYMGEFALRQTARVGDHPFRAHRRAVLVEHEHYAGPDVGIFHSQRPDVNKDKFYQLVASFPVKGQLLEFAQRGLALYEEQGLIIDTGAPQGVVLDETIGTPMVQLTDGLPILEHTAGDVRRVIGELEQLEELAA